MSKVVEDNLRNPKFNFGPCPSVETVAKLREFLKTAVFKGARTYVKFAPHAYMVSPEKKGENATEFDIFAAAVRKYGYDKKFYSKTFRYFDFDGYTYWDCAPPSVKADLINRCPFDPRCQPEWPKLPPECASPNETK